MPTVSDDAIALRTWEYSETSQTVALFTRDHGMLRALAKGSRREKSAFSGGIEVLTRGRAVAIVKRTTDLATLTSWDLLAIYWRLRRDLLAHRVGMYIADLVYHAITDADPHPGLYEILLETLQSMEAGDDPHALLSRFQWGVLREIGSRPDLNVTRDGRAPLYFDPAQSRCTPDPAPGAWPVQRRTIARIDAIDTGESPEPSPDDRKAGRFLSEYLAHVIGRDLPSRKALFGALVMQ